MAFATGAPYVILESPDENQPTTLNRSSAKHGYIPGKRERFIASDFGWEMPSY
jgi:hypothetical protein